VMNADKSKSLKSVFITVHPRLNVFFRAVESLRGGGTTVSKRAPDE
jgi:hypothetical protein